MNSHSEFCTESPITFSLWFAEKLAKKYLSWCKEDLLAKKEKLATISKSAADKKRQRDSDTDSNSRPASTSRILNASPGSPCKAPARTSRFAGMTLEEFFGHVKGLSIGEYSEIYGDI